MALTRIKVLDANSNININSVNIATTLTVSGNLVAGNVSTTSSGGSVNVPKISSIAVTNSSFVANGWQAVSNTGGYIVVNGSGFVSGAVVLIGTKTASATTFANSNALLVQVPAQVDGTYPVYVTNPDGGVAISVPGLTYNDLPVWSTGSTLPSGVVNSPISIQLSATDTTSVTYSVASGSTLPPGLTLSSSGLLSGTVTGISGLTVYTFAVNAVDTYSQNTTQTFSITIQISDPYFNYTSLLLSASTNSANTSGTSNANTVIDSSYNYNNITRVGNPGQGTFSPFGTTWSNYFGGTGNYLQTNSTPISTSLSTFTIEAWVYMTATPTTPFPVVIGDMQATGASDYWSFGVNSSNQVAFYWYTGSGNNVTGSTTMSLNTWYHIAISVNSNAISMYVNGVQQTLTGTTTLSNRSGSLNYLVLGQNNSGSGGLFTGYISNFRIVTGTALYSSTFTPPTAPLPVVANTVLLTCQSNRFIDANTTPATLTANGTVSVQRFNPFGANATPYATSSNTYIGSTYFGGNGNYLYTSNPQFNISSVTLNWTFECWLYPISSGSFAAIGSGGSYGNSFSISWGVVSNGFYIAQGIGNSGTPTAQTSSSYPGNTWYHIALTRNGTSGQTTLWVNGANATSFNYTSGSFSTGTTFLLNGLYDNIGLGNSGGTFYISNARFVANTVLYNSNFIPQSTSPLTSISNTIILTAQSTQTVTYDANTTPNSITTGGVPRPTKNIPFSQSWAGQFNGTGYLSIPNNSQFYFGTNPFTIEFWYYPVTPYASQNGPGIGQKLSDSYGGWVIYRNNVNNSSGISIRLSPQGGGTTDYYGPPTIVSNTWQHHAIVRDSSNNLRWYLNGALSNTYTGVTVNITDTNTTAGMFVGYAQTWSYITGTSYISNLRILNGTALYTGNNFTVSNTPLTAIANTVLLTCQNGSNSNTFIDNSTNGFTITNVGTPGANVVSMAAPGYSPMPSIIDSSSAATTYSGSYYLNGSTDYLSIPTLPSLGSNNFTIEGWVYPNANTADSTIFFINAATSAYAAVRLGWSYNSGLCTLYLLTSTSGGSWVGGTSTISNSYVPINSWTHLAVVRNGNNLNLFQNGILIYTNSSISGSLYAGTLNWIGCYVQNTSYYYFPGYVSNARIITGTALYTTNFTPPTAPLLPTANIAYSGPANTALLLSGTNVGAYDSTMINDFINVGGVSVNSNVKQYGINSYYFNGSSYLYQANSVNLQSGTGDFTLESWIYPTNVSGSQTVIEVGRASSGTTPGFQIDIISGVFYVYYGSTIASSITGSSASNGTWYHVAVSRASGSLRFFINGTQVGSTGTDNTNYTQGYLWIGANPGGSSYFTGYLQDVRFTKGYARYTSNFTVPSTPFLTQ